MEEVTQLDLTSESRLDQPIADVGVFGGSGFYGLLDDPEKYQVDTPYGAPSDVLTVGEFGGRRVAFLPRHGADHRYPPHTIPFRANLYAFKHIGIKAVFGPCAAGSLSPDVSPGEFVVCDQLVDRTKGREETYFDEPVTTHVSFADPYSEDLRERLIAGCVENGIDHHADGTVVVIQGPRFSTRAESAWFQKQGWEVINMTQYPECYLARELELPYANVSLITDYDVGLEGRTDVEPVSHEKVVEVFEENNRKLRELLQTVIAGLPGRDELSDFHGTDALTGARFT